MSRATYLVGDVFERMAELPDGSIDLVLTSPPFFALRSYLPDDHPDKDKEIGSEVNPAEFLDTLLSLTAEWGRLISPTGSIAVELGDTYGGSGGAGGDYYNDDGLRAGQLKPDGAAKRQRNTPKGRDQTAHAAPPARIRTRRQLPGFPLDKSICGVPWLYALSLSWGVNLLTGEPSPAGQWRVRNVVAWCRPNPSPGALGDKVKPATSYITIATKSAERWFDLDAVRVPVKDARPRSSNGPKSAARAEVAGHLHSYDERSTNPAGAPPLDHWWHDEDLVDQFVQDAWLVSTESYKGAHFATWPRKLLTLPIDSMCPRQVCTECGEPSRRIIATNSTGQNLAEIGTGDDDARQVGAVLSTEIPDASEITTIGWSSCSCAGATPTTWDLASEREWKAAGKPDWSAVYLGQKRLGRLSPTSSIDPGGPITNTRNGIVLDPFGGSGTTLAVATGHGRDAIGIDLDERNADLALDRVGPMFLDVEMSALALTREDQ